MSSRSLRTCIACGGPTSVAHLGMDLCRACSVFYKRSIGRERYECKADNACEITNEGRSCRACRLVLIERLLKESGDSPDGSVKEEEEVLPDEPCCSKERSIASSLSLLVRLRVNYRAMCKTRMNAELHARADPPHPMEYDVEKPPLYQTTYCTIDRGNHILLTSSLEFAASSFPKFCELSKQMKWKLALNFFFRFRYFEGCYRANRHFPDYPDRALLSYTAWLSMDDLENFFSDCPHGDIDGAYKYMLSRNIQGVSVSTCREVVARLDPSQDEFLLVIALMFWTVDGISDCDQEVVELASTQRNEIHREMQAYYRNELGLNEYASRMGELLSYVTLFDVSEHVKQHYEMFRLFGLFKDDSFTYRLREV